MPAALHTLGEGGYLPVTEVEKVGNPGFHLRKELMPIRIEAKGLRQPFLWGATWDLTFLTHSPGITWLPGKGGPTALVLPKNT